ncbi:ProQ/FINO family protein [Roseibium sediminicola]|uniref:ProQ/FinO family protein n=1 Tax=Roseibium sediminicola TaxID=2933272 RepID=A0ABT0H2W3_9HYPH|nr:ProQ/FINO family protein [Roseibium sp. CAU 1639]MCK7616025.1 ProQ/FinO family protein [Roseibium sp. CAU 1639]
MINPDESNEHAAALPAKVQSSVNSAKKTLRLFGSGPAKSDPAAAEPETESSSTPETAMLSGGNEPQDATPTRRKKIRDRRVLKPGFKTKVLNQLTEALGISKTVDLPKIFLAERVSPMKIGIADDLLARYPNARDRKVVKKALGVLVRSLTYSNAVIEEDRRYDLDLNPVYDATGEITEKSRADAQNNIKSALAKIRKSKTQDS